MKKLLLPQFQGCTPNMKDNFGIKSFLLLGLFLISFSGLAQGPGSPYVDAGQDIVIPCGDDCAELTASFLDTGETTRYEVIPIDYAPPFPFTGGTPVSVDIDDRWSPLINLPFDFCFFGQAYDKMIIGSNAVISFETNITTGNTQAPNDYCAWSFNTRDAIPSPDLFLTTIFGPYMDVNPEVAGTGTINWFIDGTAPNRSMVVNFPHIPYYGSACQYTMFLTSQVVIYETTNVVEIYVQDRPSGCSWQNGVAVMGIQNQDGTQGYTPPGRNTSDWSATNEAWRFTPAGDSNVEFAWLDEDGNIVGTDKTITVCPDQDTTYTAKAIWYNCNGDIVTVTDDVTVTLEADFQVDLGGNQDLCDTSSYVITATISNGNPNNATYLWNTGETSSSITVTASGTYSVQVTIDGCTITRSVVINFNDTPNIDLGTDQNTCFETPVVLDASPLNYSDPTVLTYTWHHNGVVIPGATSHTLNVTDAGNYSVDVTIGACSATADVNIGIGQIDVDLGPDTQTCFDTPIVLDATPSGYAAGDATYEWTKDGQVIPGATSATLTITEIGVYGVTVKIGDCIATDSVQFTPGNNLDVRVTMDGFENSTASVFEVCPNEPRMLRAHTDEQGVTFQWFLNGNIIPGATNDTYEVSIDAGIRDTQVYSVEISSGACIGTDSVDVRLYPVGNCVISQGLSPNGDGYNDTLDLTFLNDRTGIKKLQIFNRYGTLVFEKNNYVNQWSGQANDGKELPTGTYFYVIDLDGNDPVYGHQTTGWIYLNRKAN